MRHWFPSVPVSIWSLVFMILIFLSNFFSVKIFAESEFWFAAVKVAAIVAFIILGRLAVVFVWMAIALCQLKFRQKWLKEGHTEDELKFKTPSFHALVCLYRQPGPVSYTHLTLPTTPYV